jgi:hypothetical protein
MYIFKWPDIMVFGLFPLVLETNFLESDSDFCNDLQREYERNARHFGTGTIRHQDTSAPGQFGTRTLRHLCETFRHLCETFRHQDSSALVFFSLILRTKLPIALILMFWYLFSRFHKIY